MDDTAARLTISAFGRLVGLSPSALRFYDDCDLLSPTRVDPHSGYRYYAAGQERRGVLIRRLREVGVPLAQIRQVVDGSPAQAEQTLRVYAETSAARATRAREVTRDVLAVLVSEAVGGGASCVAGGPELASAVRQVAPAAAEEADVPPLEGVLLEVEEDELTLVATNRYWLALRTILVTELEGGPGRAVVGVRELTSAAAWARRHDRVRLRIADRVDLQAGGQTHTLDRLAGEFPQYRGIFEGIAQPALRIIVDRHRLIELLERPDVEDAVVLTAGADHLDLRLNGDRHGIRLDAVGSGTPMSVAFDPALLAGALRAGVGPDAVLDCVAPDRVVTVRSADQGTFTTLVMPVRLTRAPS